MSHTKLWIITGILAVTAAAGAAGLNSTATLYKGKMPAAGKSQKVPRNTGKMLNQNLYSSVLNVGGGLQKSEPIAPALPNLPDFSKPRPQFITPQRNAAAGNAAGRSIKAIPPQQPVTSPCGGGQMPIYKDMKFSGCRQPETNNAAKTPYVNQTNSGAFNTAATPISTQTWQPPTPIQNNAQPTETCESKGQFTYTGEDRPGLLYGMCIKCNTEEYLRKGQKC